MIIGVGAPGLVLSVWAGGLVVWLFVSLVSQVFAASLKPEAPMVVTQVPRKVSVPPASWSPKSLVRSDWFDGARIVVVASNGQVRLLTEGFHSACDPSVSFDGQKVLFAGRKEAGAHWRAWEIGLDGQGLRPVSPQNLDARSPIYATTLFTLDSPEPWFTSVFVGRDTTVAETGGLGGSSLYSVRLDGADLRRLTWNPNHNFDPFQGWDGRLIYAAERRSSQPDGRASHVGLYAIHVEGADMEFYGGELGSTIQQMPCLTPGGLVVLVEADQPTWDGAGQLACLQANRPHVTYRRLTDDPAQVFLYPSPLSGNRVLVSRRAAQGDGNCGIFSFDADTRECKPVFDSPEYHEAQAVVARSRPRPDGHSTVVNTATNTGIFYGLNCCDADKAMAPHLQTGMVKRVRFIEGVLQTTSAKGDAGTPVARRLVGEAPVEPDGSFNVEVPASAPLLLQTLDDRGMALGTCGWIWVQPKETRGCIGCHEDPERIPENEYVQALRRPSNRLALPPEQRRTVTFREDVAPLLQKHCATAECHGGQNTPLRLPLVGAPVADPALRQAFAALKAPLSQEGRESTNEIRLGRYVDPGRARTSWLAWQLAGTNTSRPWDQEFSTAGARKVRLMPPSGHAPALSGEDMRTVIQWIDLGAQFEAARPSRKDPAR
jgi:hypothetical protein